MASSFSWVATIPTDRKEVIGELTRGREMADQLRAILRDDDADSVLPAQGLVAKILDTFTQSLLLLSGSGDSDEVSQLPAVVNSPGLNFEDSGDCCKKPAPKDRRGCYKRRRTSETWTKESTTMFEDGHAWRKYGQKVILHAIHPRNYFRCTHKYDQGCQATKQVQKVEDDPVPLFRTTYHGHHTCTTNSNILLVNKSPHHIIMDATNDSNAIIWSFQSHDDEDYKAKKNRTGSAVTNPPPTPTALVINNCAIKQEIRSSSSSSSHELSAGGGGNQLTTIDLSTCCGDYDDHHELGAVSADHGADVISSSDVYSCTASTHSTMDMDDFMVDSVFEDFLQFR